jgi:hypothetical protein
MKYPFPAMLLALVYSIACPLAWAQEEGEAAPSVLDADPDVVITEDAPAEDTPVEEAPRTTIIEQKRDVLTMPQNPVERAAPMSLPQHGMKMEEVESRYGAPLSRDSAVGTPPITRWNYDGFSVFFEHRTVLHAVQKDRPAEIYRKDELLPASSP